MKYLYSMFIHQSNISHLFIELNGSSPVICAGDSAVDKIDKIYRLHEHSSGGRLAKRK